WHLYNEFENGKVSGGRIRFVWIFGVIGIFVLLLACINFMNLSTARSDKRAKEIGIRKVIGSPRKQLIAQFLGESFVMAFVAMLLSIVLIYLSLSFFNTLSGKNMTLPLNNPVFGLLVVVFALLTGVIAGSYPAFYLSAFNTIKVLNGSFRMSRLAVLPRKVLVVIQFTICIGLIICTATIFRQIQFTKNRPVGYSREGLITVDMNTPDLYKDYNGLRNRLLQTTMVEDMAEANSSITEIWSSNTGLEWKGKDPGNSPLFGTIAVTHDYGKTVGWKVISGRDFSRDSPADSGAFILNESAVKLTGITDPIGKTMRWNNQERVITGVVKDMLMESPYESAHPTIFHLQYGWVNKIILRIKPTVPMRTALTSIKEVFETYNPSSPFEYNFVDEAYARKFSVEERVGKLAGFFAALAVLISCLGLFALSSLLAKQRIKEMSVRKVLGASTITL
ncbi:MAG TPA: FtsX-like permease family protein, partial [Niastella sp.]|nr:FtsX-like permease family protein [Niastella sp.]